jgi:hypothetical protein
MMYDPLEKRSRRVYVFSARLRHSRMAYRQLVFSQKQEVFFMCHVHAFEFFGGVPERVVPDNLKAAVIKASFTDPVVNRVYHRLAEHYGFVIDPCLPYRPRLKGAWRTILNSSKATSGRCIASISVGWAMISLPGREPVEHWMTGENRCPAGSVWSRKAAYRPVSPRGSRLSEIASR